MYNAEKLKDYCNWFYRRHSSFLNEMLVGTGSGDEHQEVDDLDEDNGDDGQGNDVSIQDSSAA